MCRLALPLLMLFSLSCAADPRQMYSPDSPVWLQAVGKLTVPGSHYKNGDRHHHEKHCTATLVTEDIILSGWLCLEYYTDLSQDIVFTLPNTKPLIKRTARDSGLGADDQQLSYHPGCEILHQESYRVATNCVALKGSSGGPIVHQQTIVGVVSAGDSEQLSYYTPSNSFISAVRLYLH